MNTDALSRGARPVPSVTKAMGPDHDEALAYQWQILPEVSRTFALTIPQLPDPLDLVVANAYLWCRVADTIEDEPGLVVARKQQLHDSLMAVLDGHLDAGQWALEASSCLTDGTLAAERELVGELPRLQKVVESFSDVQQQAIRLCLTKMCNGMTHFEAHASTSGLATMKELDCYCYFVAGVVGEMLTTLFCDYSTEIAAEEAALSRLATSFGQGLQLTNILKDLFDDYQEGRCWLPREVFQVHGFDLDSLNPEGDRAGFNEALLELVGVAHGHLRNALEYALTIPRDEVGIRRFCLWSLGLAVLTLRKLVRHLDYHCAEDVKISRTSVALTVAITNALVHHDRPFRFLADALTRQVPRVEVSSGFSFDQERHLVW